MQRSSTRFIGCMCKQQFSAPLLARRQMADYGNAKNPPKAGKAATASSNKPTTASVSPTRSVNRLTSTVPRPILRENNMWTEPQRVETKWLRSRDPRCYKPDFKQTEPLLLRKQFMRSPDERTRDAMSREWETTIRNAATLRRQEFLEKQRQEKEQAKKAARTAMLKAEQMNED